MEQDRAEVDLGVAADLEQAHSVEPPKQPKKRFVGRRQAVEAAARNGSYATGNESKEIQGLINQNT